MPENETNDIGDGFENLSPYNVFMLQTLYNAVHHLLKPFHWCIEEVNRIPITLYHIAILPFSDDLKFGRLKTIFDHEVKIGRITQYQYIHFLEALERDETRSFINDVMIPPDVGIAIDLITLPLVPVLTWLLSNDTVTTLKITALANGYIISLSGGFRYIYSAVRTAKEIKEFQNMGILSRKHEIIFAFLTTLSAVKAVGYLCTPWISKQRNIKTGNKELPEMARAVTNYYLARTCNCFLGRILGVRYPIRFAAFLSARIKNQVSPLINTDFQTIR